MKMFKRKGFTLIELLATIVILGIVVSISIFVATRIIKNSKEKTYKVTISEIESNANNYLSENAGRLVFLKSSDERTEYQCITVQNLIDYGYLRNNVVNASVSDKSKVLKGDYIYLERDANSKAITKSLYIGDVHPEYADVCGVAVRALGAITFNSNPGLEKWSQFKNITITYNLSNLNDVNTIGQYTYVFSYDGEHEVISDKGNVKQIKVTSNGKLTASVMLGDTVIETNKIDVTTIDTAKPISSIQTTSTLKAKTQTATLKCSDNIGVVEYYWGTSQPNANSKYTSVEDTKNMSINKTINNSGTYYLACKDNAGNISTNVSQVYYKYTVDNLLETVDGTKGNYTTTNYVKATSDSYLAPQGTALNLSSIYTVPDYSNSSNFSGVSIGVADNKTVTISKDAPTLESDNIVYTMWFNRNRVVFKFKPGDGGTVQTTTKSSDGKSTYSWSVEAGTGLIKQSINGKTAQYLAYSLKSGATTLDLPNYNNANYLNITKSGYHTDGGKQWVCESGCDIASKVFSHEPIYMNASDICSDATLKSNDCNVVIKVNWIQDPPPPSSNSGSEPCWYCWCGGGCGGGGGGGGSDCCCFLKGTKVMTILGLKNIEDLKIGELVLTYNELTGKNEYKKVVRPLVHENLHEKLYTLYIEDHVLNVTESHRFYIKNEKGYSWIPAINLKVGDYVKYIDGSFHTIDKITYKPHTGTVYNIEVDGNHNYYVTDNTGIGNNLILVHNLKNMH